MKLWFVRFHRWLALLFALPLLVVIGTGLFLSFEPWLVTRAIVPGSLTAEKVQSLLAAHDPAGRARALAFRSYDGTLTIGGRGGGVAVNVATGEPVAGRGALAEFLQSSRRIHEHFLFDASWLVIGSSIVMLALALLGVIMGWPSIRNTLLGWHQAMGWGLLPLVVLSPLTGLFLAWGITLSGPPPEGSEPGGAPMRLAEAVRIVGQTHDLSSLVWLRERGGRMLARVVEDGEFRVYAVTPHGTLAMPRNLPRLWHEGNFAGAWSSLLNVITSLALLGLLVTGPWLWLRRKIRMRNRRRAAGG